jgi:heme exporter protein D
MTPTRPQYLSYKKREQLTTGSVVCLLWLCLFVIVVIVVFVCYCFFLFLCVCISSLCVVCGVMVSVLASSVIVGGFEPRSRQTRDYIIDMSCFSAKNAALRRKTGWLGIRISADCFFSELAL